MIVTKKAKEFLVVALETQVAVWEKQLSKRRLGSDATSDLDADRMAIQGLVKVCKSSPTNATGSVDLKLNLSQLRLMKMALETQVRVWNRLHEGGGLSAQELEALPRDLKLLEDLIRLVDRKISDGLEVSDIGSDS